MSMSKHAWRALMDKRHRLFLLHRAIMYPKHRAYFLTQYLRATQ